MTREEARAKYIHHVLETGGVPPSVFAFARDHGFSEREFFEEFGSFEALESSIWEDGLAETIRAVESGEEWGRFTAQQRLLSLLFAHMDRVLDQRSFYLARFPRERRSCRARLAGMKGQFLPFAERLVDGGKERGEIACRGALTRGYPSALFGHLVSVIHFNLADTSRKFERTDAFIEKTVRLAFDLIGTQAVDSAFDLVRFLYGREHRSGSAPQS